MKKKILLSLFVLVILAIVVLLGILLLSQNNNTSTSEYEKLKDDIEVLVIDPATYVPYEWKVDESKGAIGAGAPDYEEEDYYQLSIDHAKKLTGKDLSDVFTRGPLSYGSALPPLDPGFTEILYKATVKNLTDYVDRGKIKTEKSEWDVYNYTNRKFKDLYNIYYDPARDNYIDYVLHNKKDEKFIVLGPEIPLDDDLEGLLLALIRYVDDQKGDEEYENVALIRIAHLDDEPFGMSGVVKLSKYYNLMPTGADLIFIARIQNKWEANSRKAPGDDSFIKFLLKIELKNAETKERVKALLKSELEKTPVSYVQIDNY